MNRLGCKSRQWVSLKKLLLQGQKRFHQSNQDQKTNGDFFGKFFVGKDMKWYPIPISVGIAWIALLQLKHSYDRPQKAKHNEDYLLEGPMHIHFYSTLPLRSLSRWWGAINSYRVPEWFRGTLYGLYSYLFNCKVHEAMVEDLKHYPNLSSFFYRQLKDGVRPIDKSAILTSPSDGRILHFGLVDGKQRIEQIKGVTYSLQALIGKQGESKESLVQIAKKSSSETIASDEQFAEINSLDYSLDKMMGTKDSGVHDYSLHSKNNALFFCVIYLAPGDYHRFHSPADWKVEKRRHFAGELFSVSPWMVNRLKNLFVLNERVVLLGEWAHGFFSMIPVGATNVGSIKINFDPELRTNTMEKVDKKAPGTYQEVNYKTINKNMPIILQKGQEMGGFQLGSTVVLVFEAPKDKFKFVIEAGNQIEMGKALGVVRDE